MGRYTSIKQHHLLSYPNSFAKFNRRFTYFKRFLTLDFISSLNVIIIAFVLLLKGWDSRCHVATCTSKLPYSAYSKLLDDIATCISHILSRNRLPSSAKFQLQSGMSLDPLISFSTRLLRTIVETRDMEKAQIQGRQLRNLKNTLFW